MFAFAIWDVREQKLLLARDRIGKKPLFYGTHDGRFVFGSELDVFKAVPRWPLQVSLRSYRQYLTYGYVPGSDTILEGVSRLPAGHFGVVNRSGLRIQSYWSLPSAPGPDRSNGDPREAAERLEGVLQDAVACRLESDVPLGCFLSGGVDSSLVAALAQESLGRPLQTYTVGFENSPASEAAHAVRVARHLGAQHHELSINPRSMITEFEAILSSAAEPLGDDSYVPTYLVSRETRRFVTVALSGDGGDELFAGYEKYRQFVAARAWRRLPLPWKLISKLAPSDAWHKKASALSSGSEMELARWLSSLWKAGEADTLMAFPGARSLEPDLFERAWRLRSQFPTIERWMLADVETYLEGDILVKVDRASMAVALEARSPFLDVPFMEEAMRWSCRATEPEGGKSILKSMLARRMPAGWFDRPKQGFGLPLDQWFRGELSDVLKRCTRPERLRQRGLLRPDVVQLAVEAHLNGRRNFARKLYAVLAFEVWADRFFGADTELA
jgi:asparagine synthase (glutamine-hydrolysing)